MTSTTTFDIQGHRGARGLLPENTLPGFLLALDMGVTTLELDVVISADSRVVVSHDPVMSSVICSWPGGHPVNESDDVRLFDLTYEQIAAFDCGKRGHPGFPEQRSMPTSKPLLSDVIDAVRRRVEQTGRSEPLWNIETKSTPGGDGTMHPDPETFTRLLYSAVANGGILSRSTIQSFDVRTLQAARRIDPSWQTALLVPGPYVHRVADGLDVLGFVPTIYSPDHTPLTADIAAEVRARGMLLIPWTVNERARMTELREMGADGIISDYPNRAVDLFR